MIQRVKRRIGIIMGNIEKHMKKFCSRHGMLLTFFVVLACFIRIGNDMRWSLCLKSLIDTIIFLWTLVFLGIQIYELREKDTIGLGKIVCITIVPVIVGFVYVYHALGLEEGIDAIYDYLNIFAAYIGLASTILAFNDNESKKKLSNDDTEESEN